MIVNIQILRALAALMVVFVHCSILVAPIGIPLHAVESFASGVDLFFVISGFIIVQTTQKQSITPWSFMLNRIARVVPLYWLLTILTFAIALFFPNFLGGTKAVFTYLLKSLFFIPYVREDGSIRPILFLGWSLNYEMFFYVIFALGLFLQSPFRRAIAVGASILGLVVIGQLSGHNMSAEAYIWTGPIMIEFVMGVAIGTFYAHLPASRQAALVGLVLAPLFLVMLILSSWLLPDMATIIRAPAAAGLLICALLMERGGLAIKSRPLVLLGDASYALYLTHPFVAQGITKFAVDLHILNSATSILFVVAIYALACTVAVLVFKYVERPLTRATRRALGISRQLVPVRGL